MALGGVVATEGYQQQGKTEKTDLPPQQIIVCFNQCNISDLVGNFKISDIQNFINNFILSKSKEFENLWNVCIRS